MAINTQSGVFDIFSSSNIGYSTWGEDIDGYVEWTLDTDDITLNSTFSYEIYLAADSLEYSSSYLLFTSNMTLNGNTYYILNNNGSNVDKDPDLSERISIGTSYRQVYRGTISNIRNTSSKGFFDPDTGEPHSGKTFRLEAGIGKYSDTSQPAYVIKAFISGSMDELEPLTQPSNIYCSSAQVEQTALISIVNKKDGVTNTIGYEFGSLTGTIAVKTTRTSIDWIIPSEFANQFASTQTNKTGTLTCDTYNGSNYIGSSTCEFTVIRVIPSDPPTLSPTVVDVNTTTRALTGNQNTLIRYKSTASFAVNASGKNGATIVSQQVRNGSTVVSGASGTIPNVESNVFDFTVVDSKGVGASATVTKNWIPYVRLTCSQRVILELENESDAVAHVTISGNYYQGSFGSTSNTLKVENRYTNNNGTWTAWSDVSSNISYGDGTYTAEFDISGFSYTDSYVFQCRATDKFGTVTTSEYTVRVSPVFDWSGDDFAVNVPMTVQGGRCYGANILYEGSSSGTITLSEPLTNFDYIDICYNDNNGRGGGLARIYGNTTADLSIVEASSATRTYVRRTSYTCYGATLTPNAVAAGYVLIDGTSISHSTGTSYIEVTKVIGYR